MLGPVPVASVVGLEVAIGGLALLLFVASTPVRVLGVLLLVLGCAWAVPVRGVPLGSRLLRRALFAVGVHALEVSPGSVRAGRTATGEALGLLDRPPLTSAVLSVRARDQGVFRVGQVPRVPLGRIAERLGASGIEQVSVTLLDTPRGREGDIDLVVRVDPLAARVAIEVRGGGRTGVDATVATAAGIVAATVRDAGLDAVPVGPEALAEMAAAAVDPESGGTWSERWSEVITGGLVHRVLTAHHIRVGADTAVLRSVPDGAVSLALVVHPLASGPSRAQLSVLLSDASAGGLQRSTRAVTESGRLFALHPQDGRHGEAVATAGILGPSAAGTGRDVGWVDLDSADLDALSPPRGGGGQVGALLDGSPVRIVLGAEVTGRVVTVGEGWLPSALVDVALDHAVPVTVVSARPAPWRALARQWGGDLLRVVEPTDPDSAGSAGSMRSVSSARDGLTVLDGPEAIEGTAQLRARIPGRVVLLALGSSSELLPDVVPAADAVLMTRGAVPPPEREVPGLALRGLDRATLPDMAGRDVVVSARGVTHIVRMAAPR